MKYNQKDSYIVHFTLIQTAHITCIAMSIEFSLNILWKFKCFFDLLVSDILKGNNHQKTGNPTNYEKNLEEISLLPLDRAYLDQGYRSIKSRHYAFQ